MRPACRIDQIITIPFAHRWIDAFTASMATQLDTPNVQQSIAPDPLGAEVHTFFGCWLDINQPSAPQLPAVVFGDAAGPFSGLGPLLPIQSFAKSDHQCLIAEISYDIDPIPTGADPASNDKLAQRNLSFVNVPNPGQVPLMLRCRLLSVATRLCNCAPTRSLIGAAVRLLRVASRMLRIGLSADGFQHRHPELGGPAIHDTSADGD